MDPRSAGGVGRNTESERSSDARTTGGFNSGGGRIDMGALSNIGTQGALTAANMMGPHTVYGAPIHTNQYGSVALDPQHWQALNEKVAAYNQAARRWNTSAQQPSLANAINNTAPMGFSMEAPNINRPATYVGGDYHLGVNPMGLLGSVVGMGTMIPGAGSLLGAGLGKAYNAAGGQDVMLGGGQIPAGWANPSGPMSGPPGSGYSVSQMAGKPNDPATTLQQLAALHENIPGNPSAPVSVGTAPTAPKPTNPAGPNYAQIMGGLQQISPGYAVNLPSYQYLKGGATV